MPRPAPPAARELAKELYMIPSPKDPAKHLHTNVYIAEKIEERFGCKCSRHSICQWTKDKRYGPSWEEEFERNVRSGVYNTIREEILIEDAVPIPHLLDAPKLEETEQEPKTYQPEIIPEIISQEEATKREQEITKKIREESEKHYKNSVEIYEAEQDMIKVIIAVHYGEAQRMIKEYEKVTNIPTDVFNERIPKHIQRLMIKDELARASQLAAMRAEGMGQQAKRIDYSKFTLAELMQVVETWEEADEHIEY
jgi:hypothetical protein